MAFETATFTTAGTQLLASITTSKALRIKRVFVDTGSHDAGDFEQDAAWWETEDVGGKFIDASVDAVGKIGEKQARLIVKLTPAVGSNGGTACTIVITACGVESGVETDEIVLCGITDPSGVDVYRTDDRITVSTCVAIYFEFFTAEGTFNFETSINPDYVIHSELDQFMSCHVTGDTTSGEAQTVLGVKSFSDGIAAKTVDLQHDPGVSAVTLFGGTTSSGIAMNHPFCFDDNVSGTTLMVISCPNEESALVEIIGELTVRNQITCGDIIAKQSSGTFKSLNVTGRAVINSLAVTTCMADTFEGNLTGDVTGNLNGLIPVGVDNNYCPDKGGLCVMSLKSTTATSQTMPGAVLTKVDATDNWTGSNQDDYILRVSSLDGVQISSTAAWNVGVQLQVLSTIGRDGVFLAIRIA